MPVCWKKQSLGCSGTYYGTMQKYAVWSLWENAYQTTVFRADNTCSYEVRARGREEAPLFHSLWEEKSYERK